MILIIMQKIIQDWDTFVPIRSRDNIFPCNDEGVDLVAKMGRRTTIVSSDQCERKNGVRTPHSFARTGLKSLLSPTGRQY